MEYADEETAKQQRAASPDLITQTYTQNSKQLIDATAASINMLGWELVKLDGSTGIIEAIDTTIRVGFKDDAIVHITYMGHNRLLDVGIKSRIGKSDLSINPKRIQTFLDSINKILGYRNQ